MANALAGFRVLEVAAWTNEQAVANVRHSRGGLVVVDRDPHQFGAGTRQCFDLRHRTVDIRGIGVGHRLHDYRRASAHRTIDLK